MAIHLAKESEALVQGMTGGEDVKHTRRRLAAGADVVAVANVGGRAVGFRPDGAVSVRVAHHQCG